MNFSSSTDQLIIKHIIAEAELLNVKPEAAEGEGVKDDDDRGKRHKQGAEAGGEAETTGDK